MLGRASDWLTHNLLTCANRDTFPRRQNATQSTKLILIDGGRRARRKKPGRGKKPCDAEPAEWRLKHSLEERKERMSCQWLIGEALGFAVESYTNDDGRGWGLSFSTHSCPLGSAFLKRVLRRGVRGLLPRLVNYWRDDEVGCSRAVCAGRLRAVVFYSCGLYCGLFLGGLVGEG